MKKLLALSTVVLALAACSQDNNRPQPPHGNNQALETAMKECRSANANNETAFESCMKQKGFEKPSGTPPQGQPPKAPNAN